MSRTLGRHAASGPSRFGSVDGQAADPEPDEPDPDEEDPDDPDPDDPDPDDEVLAVDGVVSFAPEVPSDFLLSFFAPSDPPPSDFPLSDFPLSDLPPSDRPDDEAARESLR